MRENVALDQLGGQRPGRAKAGRLADVAADVAACGGVGDAAERRLAERTEHEPAKDEIGGAGPPALARLRCHRIAAIEHPLDRFPTLTLDVPLVMAFAAFAV